MKKKDDSRKIRSAAGPATARSKKTYDILQDSPFMPQQKTAFLTSLIGTQPLLTATAPAYPIVKIL